MSSSNADSQVDALSLRHVLVVEDDVAMQVRLRQVLTTIGVLPENVVLAGTIHSAQDHLLAQCFQLALVDVVLPDGNGIDFVEHVQHVQAGLPTVIITSWGTEDLILAALRNGAIGYLLKDREDHELATALRSIESGGAPIDPFVARHILGAIKPPVTRASPEPQKLLTCRELEILQFVAQGHTNREIAESLCLSRMTVECHIKNIYRKLIVSSRTEAVFRARTHGLLS